MSRYRLVYFIPDHFCGTRIPIGATLKSDKGVDVVFAGHIPDANCLGGRAKANLLKSILHDIHNWRRGDELPESVGPHAILSEEYGVPDGVNDAKHWISSHILPIKSSGSAIKGTRLSRRATIGYRFFRTYKVDKFVEKTFEPTKEGINWLHAGALLLDPISHWSAGKNELLLMEPVVPDSLHVEEDCRQIAKRFLEYTQVSGQASITSKNSQASESRKIRYAAYLLPGLEREQVAKAREMLGFSQAEIFDLQDESNRRALVDDIRRIGESRDGSTLKLLN